MSILCTFPLLHSNWSFSGPAPEKRLSGWLLTCVGKITLCYLPNSCVTVEVFKTVGLIKLEHVLKKTHEKVVQRANLMGLLCFSLVPVSLSRTRSLAQRSFGFWCSHLIDFPLQFLQMCISLAFQGNGGRRLPNILQLEQEGLVVPFLILVIMRIQSSFRETIFQSSYGWTLRIFLAEPVLNRFALTSDEGNCEPCRQSTQPVGNLSDFSSVCLA